MPTISPTYIQKGVSNPYYNINSSLDLSIKQKLKILKVKFKNLVYKCVVNPTGKLVQDNGGKYSFQLVEKDTSSLVSKKDKILQYYVQLIGKNITGHYGQATRKDATASSNVNEYCTVHFLINKFSSVKDFNFFACKNKDKPTGVRDGADTVISYARVCELLDKDETMERDVEIGYKNSLAVKKDIKKKIEKVFWVPKAKPAGISPKNPSDIILLLNDGNYVGYSLKITSGVDATPKFNTNITAFYGKLENKNQLSSIQKMIDKSWNTATKKIDIKTKHAYDAINTFDITKEDFSESSSRDNFSKLAKEFKKDKLDFYADGFYYAFRNNLIKNLGNMLLTPENLVYFLNTIYFYTYDDPRKKQTPCPYKLLIGSDTGESTIKDVAADSKLKDVLVNEKVSNLKKINFDYDNQSQSFEITFNFKDTMSVIIPVTCRTRAAGGWSGKSLYINTPGLKIEKLK